MPRWHPKSPPSASDVRVPADLPAMQTYVSISLGNVCSPAQKLWIR